ncbi:uncharacterized protein LOC101743699 isoform X2 [Bombyx mori]|nr:uncharacterized protein LOC101743699 isoform X2 [Bombyx mori]
MHEYIHDFFQFGRPELLHKISRKALTMKKTFKAKETNGCMDHILQYSSLTPLQKARRALRLALNKAAEDIILHNPSYPSCSFKFDCDDSPDDLCEEEESVEIEWPDIPTPKEEPEILPKTEHMQKQIQENMSHNFANIRSTSSNESFMNFNEDSSQNANDNFCGQFLSMPELDPEPLQERSKAKISPEFYFENNKKEITVKSLNRMDSEQNSLNCVLPSVSNDQNDDIIINESNQQSHYNGEWDQMLNDFIVNKGSSQECSSELKDIYCQISKTIDLLNS